MQETLEAGREFQFEIPTENARLAGGEDWSALLKDAPVPPGGVAASFATDWRLAKTCAGLSAMSDDAAAALLTAADLRTLATRYADPLSRHGADVCVSPAARWPCREAPRPRPCGRSWRARIRAIRAPSSARSWTSRSERWRRSTRCWPARMRRTSVSSPRPRRAPSVSMPGIVRATNSATAKPGKWRAGGPNSCKSCLSTTAGNVRYPGGKAAWTASAGSDDDVLLSSAHARDAGSHRRTGAAARTAAGRRFGEAPGAALLRVELAVPLFRASDGAAP